ncbi:Hypothetical predicted protein [Cloeon dipterum]|uniref:DUF4773 domain-containing protein n=1 Tax=Cloeon dipterum TaxID=197152 RepID=A0A8S1CC74_9INSE|nr:Hypothetical predicted protein [Cloeon dipterum]
MCGGCEATGMEKFVALIALGLLNLATPSCARAHPPGYFFNVTLPPEVFADLAQEKGADATVFRAESKGPCRCLEGICKCCTGVSFASLGQEFCANMQYDQSEFEMAVSITMNNKMLYKRVVSGKNPRPVCIPVPRLRFVTLCTKFSNVYLAGPNIHTCIDMEGRVFGEPMFEMSFDCVKVGMEGVALLSPEEGGVSAGGGQTSDQQPQKPSNVDDVYDQLDPEDYTNDNLQEDVYEPTPITPVKKTKKKPKPTPRPTSKTSDSHIVRIQPMRVEGKVNLPSLPTTTFIEIEEIHKTNRRPRE